jgi:hypothetical protein
MNNRQRVGLGKRGSLAAEVLIMQRTRVTRNTECGTNCG